MKKHCEVINTLFLKSGARYKFLQICIAFLPFMVDLKFGKILNIIYIYIYIIYIYIYIYKSILIYDNV